MERNLPDERIEFLPPCCTVKHQPLDLSMIAHRKTLFRSTLLLPVIEIIFSHSTFRLGSPSSSQQGRLGLQDGFSPHVGDAITLFDDAWSLMSRSTVIRCWIKSNCLSPKQCEEAKQILWNLPANHSVAYAFKLKQLIWEWWAAVAP